MLITCCPLIGVAIVRAFLQQLNGYVMLGWKVRCQPVTSAQIFWDGPLIGRCPRRVDFVAKVFLGCRTKILRAADAFCARRREGPYRFIQNRSRTSVVALKSDAAAEKSKDQLSRDFWGCSIFDFCNNICQNRK